jgi:Holliday junction resolvase RusA-like endonuclease
MNGVTVLSFWVPGHPKTKGSLNINPGPKCRCTPSCPGYKGRPTAKDSPGSSRWRLLVAYQAVQAMQGEQRLVSAAAWPLQVELSVGLLLEYRLNVTGELGVIGNGAGDLDKLDRNVLDALTDAGVYVDDVQVTQIWSSKAPAIEGVGPGVRVKVMI